VRFAPIPEAPTLPDRKCKSAAKFPEQMNIRSRHAAVLMSPRIVIFKLSILPFRSRIVSRSNNPRRMFVRPVACIDHGNIQMRATKSAAPEARAHHQAVWLHRVKRVDRIQQDSPFFRLEVSACRFMVSAQAAKRPSQS